MPKKPIDHYEHPDKLPNNPTQELSGFAEDSETGFEEFSTTQALIDFDVADRKFIAVAMAYERDHHRKATILQALDTKWEPFRKTFEREGLQIDFLCPPEDEV